MIMIRPTDVVDTGAFTRTTIASYYNLYGLVAFAPVNEPRLNYDPSDLTAPPGILLEAAATNLLLRSQDFTNGSWVVHTVAGDIVVNIAPVAAPDGTMTANKIEDLEVTTDAWLSQAVTVANDALTRTLSIFLREGNATNTTISCVLSGGSGVNVSADIDWSAGTTSAGTLTQIGEDGWFRLALPLANNTSGNTTFTVNIRPAGTTNAAVGYVYAWGAQLETGAVATSYIATAGSAVIRAADVGTPAMASNVLESEVQWSVSETYAKGEIVRGTGSNIHQLYISAAVGNIGNAVTDTAWWVPYAPTNRMEMFDGTVNSQTTNLDSIAVAIPVSGRVDSVVLLNLSALSVRVIMEDPIDGVVFDETISLISTDGIDNWYSYFYDPITRITDIWIRYLPPNLGATVKVILLEPGATVALGACVIGLSSDLGGTEYGARLGITDYSVKQADDFGNYTILKRAFSRNGSFSVHVPAGQVDKIYKQLSDARATPIVWIGSEFYTSSMIYGFYKDFNLEIAYKRYSLYSLELEGLT